MQQQQPAGPDPLIGLTIGNYKIKSKLGEGGMGSVYLAEHPLIGKQVALKVLHQEFATNKDVVARFFTEAKAVNDIQHPNIVDIVDYGELHLPDGANMVYFIMEFLDGNSLAHLIRTEAPLAPERALSISMQIADSLAASHAQGIVHRDLKPDNVILIKRGRATDFVKVLDFGIAKLTGDQPGSRRTRTGIVMGTPAYMSPEQCEGRGNIDHRTDIYALGILLYELITGRVPFVGEGYGEILVQHLTQAPARPTTIRGVIPPHVEMVCLKALEKRVEDRYPNMEEFMKALADPVGYVEAHGGLQGFLRAQLVATGGPLPAVGLTTPTPSPLRPLTPVPGTLSPVTPGPGSLTAMPTPGAGYIPTPFPMDKPARSRAPLIIVVALLVAGLGIGGFLLFGRGGSNDSHASGDGDEGGSVAEGPSGDQGGDTAQGGVTPGGDTKPEGGTVEGGTPEGGTKPEGGTPEGGTKPEGGTPEGGTKPEGGTPPVVPPKPVEVTVNVSSTPDGADVYVDKERKARGKTPLSIKMPKGDKQVLITLKKSGYQTKESPVVPSQPIVNLDAALDKRVSSGTPSGGKPSGGKPSGGKPSGGKPTGHKPGPVGGVDDDDIIRPK